MSNSIDETIKLLEEEIREKQSVVKVLRQMQKKDSTISDSNTFDSSSLETNNSIAKIFPKDSRTDTQVMWLFDNVFNVPQKYSTIQRKFNELLGAEKNVYNVCRLLKKAGHLATVQYNKQNKLTFWGKCEWVGERDFKDNFNPSQNELPFQIFDTKILTDDEELGK